MKGHRSPGIAALAALLLLAACGPAPAPEPEPDPAATPPALSGAATDWNVLLVSVDTLRADRLGAWGYDRRLTSPRLDQLVASGTRFDRASAPRAITWPSLATVLSGLYPSGHGVVQNGYDLPDDVETMPRILHRAGYQTGAFLGNMCSANHTGWDQFFCGAGKDPDVNREAWEWAKGIDHQRPFLMWVHYFGAHSPYYNGGAFLGDLVEPGYRGPVHAKKGALNRIMTDAIDLDGEDLDRLDTLYDAAVMGTDANAASLLDALGSLGLLEKTLVVFTADHGEDLYDHHGYIYHACSVYESGLHVPLAFVAPGLIPAGSVAPDPVELGDILPTVLDLLGIEAPGPFHGRSRVADLEGRPEATEHASFSQYGETRIRTAQAGDWKLVSNPDDHLPRCFEGAPPDLYPIETVELYDLATDPGETTNLAADHPERVRALLALVESRFAGLTDRTAEQEVPEELKEELRALGYLVD